MATMYLSQNGLQFIKGFEKFRPVAYPDSGGWTIGYGHHGGIAVKGAMITQMQALALLKADVSVSERAVRAAVKIQLEQNRFDALVSFAFNLGATKFAETDLVKFVNAKDFKSAGDELQRYVYSKKVKLKGLVKRRKAERDVFDGGVAFARAAGC